MISKKLRLRSLVLCYFFGFFGAHRFYVNRPLSGLIMLITLGGVGIWVILDFITILIGKFKDSENFPVKTWCDSYTFPKVLVSILIIFSSSFATYSKLKNVKLDLKNVKFSKELISTKNKLIIRKDTSNEIIKYEDKNGVTHFVNNINKIPTEYRGNAKTNLKLPELNKTN